MRRLFKTTVVVWSENDTRGWDLGDIGTEATSGDMYCSKQACVEVPDPEKDTDWDGTDFFGELDDEESDDA